MTQQKKVLVTGANGYIGRNLIQELVDRGFHVVAMVRNRSKVNIDPVVQEKITLIEGDLLRPESLSSIPQDIDAAYYLVHAMATSATEFEQLESQQARNFVNAAKSTSIKQVIYLGGLISEEKLSKHLSSRLAVENILKDSGIPYTILRAGIIIGSGSASFEIIRDLVEKLPFMIAPKWTTSKCQPISIVDMLYFLVNVLFNGKCMNQVFDVGGEEQITYKNILYGYASVRGLERIILNVPVLTPKLSSYWLYFITSTNFSLAMSLVDSLKMNAVCGANIIQNVIPRKCLSFKESIAECLRVKDHVPVNGCLFDETRVHFDTDRREIIDRIWSIGGKKGWYALNWAWKLRGWFDQLIGGVGLRRGRDDPNEIHAGDHLDFWRVETADKEAGHLLLRAEMKVPGEAWLDFKVGTDTLVQKATFRPKGLLGRAYWYALLPFHLVIFSLMAKKLVSTGVKEMIRKS